MPMVLEMPFITATLGTNVVQGIIKVAEVTAVTNGDICDISCN